MSLSYLSRQLYRQNRIALIRILMEELDNDDKIYGKEVPSVPDTLQSETDASDSQE